jgi:integrase
MASISREPNGRRTIQFVAPDGKRRSIRLGKVSQRTAEAVKVRVEALNTAAITGHPVDDEVARWVAGLDKTMADKLAAVGLIPKREAAALGPFLEGYLQSRIDVKPATLSCWRGAIKSLLEHFGPDRPLRDITEGDADAFRLYLVGQGLASTTVARAVHYVKQFLRSAVKRRLISANPFDGVSVKAVMLPGRQRFITLEETAKLLDAAPSTDWRCIIGLCRYGGLRCPSEVMALRWQDVDWDSGRITVTAPKTAHHPGKGTRTIPLFCELRALLTEAWDAAPEGEVYVVGSQFRSRFSQSVKGFNLRTTFERIVIRAGLTPWPRIFHNLRSSRETELVERFPLHVVTAWLGNTPEIARKHYLQVTEQHFAKALEAVQNPVQQPTVIARNTLPGVQATGGISGQFHAVRVGANTPALSS